MSLNRNLFSKKKTSLFSKYSKLTINHQRTEALQGKIKATDISHTWSLPCWFLELVCGWIYNQHFGKLSSVSWLIFLESSLEPIQLNGFNPINPCTELQSLSPPSPAKWVYIVPWNTSCWPGRGGRPVGLLTRYSWPSRKWEHRCSEGLWGLTDFGGPGGNTRQLPSWTA